MDDVQKRCKFECLGIEGGSTHHALQCSHCVYTTFAEQDSAQLKLASAGGDDGKPFGPGFGVTVGSNITLIQTCCPCLESLFSRNGMIPSAAFVALMESPCKTHDPLDDDDANMDDDEVALEEDWRVARVLRQSLANATRSLQYWFEQAAAALATCVSY